MSLSVESQVKNLARAGGFDLVGIASADDPLLKSAVERYSTWLSRGYGATMEYLNRHTSTKADPKKFLESSQSILCVGLLYGAKQQADSGDVAQVSLYTRSVDYHALIEEKLQRLSEVLAAKHSIASRAFVDKEPVFERFWAWRAGLGWLGKNTVLINRNLGSYFFLGGLFLSEKLTPDEPGRDHCGRCTKCIDACPTSALSQERYLDSEKCIAYHTIENKSVVPVSVMELTGRWIAGCDICQSVCPWNDPVVEGGAFENLNPAFGEKLTVLAEWTASDFKEKLNGVAMNRMKYGGFLRNLTIAIANSDLSNEEKKRCLALIETRISEVGQPSLAEGLAQALGWAKNKLSR